MQYFGKADEGQLFFGMSDNFGARLREERQRLTPKQGEFASIIGVRQSQLSEWEKGSAGLKADHLAILADAGVDVLYVVTGRRGGNLLSHDESVLLESYRSVELNAQNALLTVARCMANDTPQPVRTSSMMQSQTMHQPTTPYKSEPK